MIVSTRSAAIAEGRKFYFTGKPCIHGHIAERYVNGGCVPCKEMQATQWHADNPEKAKAKGAAYAARNPEKMRLKNASERKHETNARWQKLNRERCQASREKYLASHPGASAAATRRWEAANPDKALASRLRNRTRQKELGYPASRKWASANPEKTCLAARKRRALKLAALGSHTIAELNALRKRTGNRCAGCNLKRQLTVDHIKALTKGGSDFINNIQFLCKPCNSAKNNKDPIDFNRSRGLLL